jgi:hypothetical protein
MKVRNRSSGEERFRQISDHAPDRGVIGPGALDPHVVVAPAEGCLSFGTFPQCSQEEFHDRANRRHCRCRAQHAIYIFAGEGSGKSASILLGFKVRALPISKLEACGSEHVGQTVDGGDKILLFKIWQFGYFNEFDPKRALIAFGFDESS